MIRRVSGVAAAALLLGGASGGAGAQEAVNLYSARHYDTDQALYDGFTEETGIEVNVIEGDADQLVERIRVEGANTPADVLITVDAGRLHRADEAGVLQPIDSDVLDERIAENFRQPDGKWYGLSKRIRAIVRSEERVDPGEITTYEALAEPEWEGRVCIRSSTNIYNQSLLASMIEAHGIEQAEAWAQGIVDNMARPPQGGDTDQIRAVAAGECDVAVVNHYYYARLVKSEDEADREAASKVDIVFPNQDGRGAHANISGAGVVASAPHKEAAVQFLEYLTTDEAQAYFAEGNNEYPMVEGVEPDPVLAEWGEFKVDDVNAATYGENNAQAVKIMDRVGWK